MTDFLAGILDLSPVLILLLVGLLVFAEDALFIGFVIPGETAAVLSGVAASFGKVPLAAAIAVVVTAAIVGDTVGYEVGKHFFGPKVLHGRFLVRHQHKLARAEDVLQRRGGTAVFLGRFTAFFRAMMPALAGSAQMPYPVFLRWNAAGGVVWGTLFVLLGYTAGSSYRGVEEKAGRGLTIAVVVVVVGAFVAWRVVVGRRERRDEREYAGEPPADDPVST